MDTRLEVGDDPYVASTTVTSFRLIEALERHRGATVPELVNELDLASGTVYKHLNTLRTIGYVTRVGDEYRLGLGFLKLGLAARAQTNLYELTHETLSDLAESTGGVTALVVPEHGYGVILVQVEPPNGRSPPHREGDRVHLHATAAGKAILAYLPDDEREAWFANHDLPALTDATTTTPEQLRQDIQSVRDRRTAQTREEAVEGWQSVAAPITDGAGEIIAAVSVSQPISDDGDGDVMGVPGNLLGSVVSAIENKVRMR